MKTRILSILTFLIMCMGVSAQNVAIPDANFKTYLVGESAININGDTEIQVSEAVAFTGTIYPYNLAITDLTGIEAFVNITQLYCNNNALTSLDVSANTALTYLSCSNNALTSIDVSNNPLLEIFHCNNNAITSFDISNNTNLEEFEGTGNSLTSLDVTTNTALKKLWFYSNSVTSIDLSNNTNLEFLSCWGNNLTSLDVSVNTALTRVYCNINNLTSLNVANGNNTNFISGKLNATSNPNLTCITVDDVAYSTTNWTSIDATASFSTSCTPCVVNIPDVNFKANLIANTALNTNGDTEIQCSEATAFTGEINVQSASVTDMTGLGFYRYYVS